MGEPEPLIPDLCLDLLWTEFAESKPKKVFLTEDCVGQKFLCLLMPHSSSLRCIKYEYANDFSSVIFGVVASLPAKDCVPINKLKMMMIVDCSSSLCLYTGITQVTLSFINLMLIVLS